jgi:NADH:ubiquinone oxidoreductase subunit K
MVKSPERPISRTAVQEHPTIILSVIILLAVLCFLPVTKYFLAQDDFILLADAAWSGDEPALDFVSPNAGQFRPLSKVVYFKTMYALFGLHAVPYHILSVVVHVLNVLLAYGLLRALLAPVPQSLMVTALFALHTGSFDVLAWASCIQQLMANFFVLTSLNLGIRAIERPTVLTSVGTMVAYALGLASMEQAYAVPLILLLYALLRPSGRRLSTYIRVIAPCLALLATYLAFMLIWKGVPESGPYAVRIGSNVLSNLLIYLQWAYDFAAVMPLMEAVYRPGLTVAHVFLALLVVYNLARGRRDTVLFGLSYYALAILPLLLLQRHTYHLHNYVPLLGLLYLLTPALKDFQELLFRWKPRAGAYAVPVLIVLLAVVSFTRIRANESNMISETYLLPENSVLRKAIIARNIRDDLLARVTTAPVGGGLHMVYRGPDDWLKATVEAALGEGDAVRLFYSEPRLEVHFHATAGTISDYDPATSAVIFFDHLGHCQTADEIGDAVRVLDTP